jgi:sec-independent protein translocase protein TatA
MSVPSGGNSEGVDVNAFIQNIGGPEIILILVVIMLIFGASKLPDLARSLGASAKEFRKGVDEGAEVESKD